MNAKDILLELAEKLNLPTPIIELAEHLYEKFMETKKSLIFSKQALIAAALYYAARYEKTPRTLAEFSKASSLPIKDIAKAYHLIADIYY